MFYIINTAETDGRYTSLSNVLLEVTGTPESDFDLETAVKNAVYEYMLTEDGFRVYEDNEGSFSWDDFRTYVPNDICEKYGFCKVDAKSYTLETGKDTPIFEKRTHIFRD